ncbi:hypothetical protein [Phytopseudomonas punonensis]|uniref:Uncharacterized protein n=1 Tax=Phytopseudomonas punonensis TaxID=1220495 RepID=A0A1M7E379_9GAMM|nr:hypothetical protein [Pseudomonas punonensis]SHL86163.1 hypothetical protein SAMN05216288_2659 [Pseudomonas punonensis]
MNEQPQDHDELVLRHVREQSREQPSAALDARILAAATHAAADQHPKPQGFWQRLLNGLSDASARRRWSAAFGCLALVGVGLGLSLRTLEQAPDRYDAPVSTLQRQAPIALPAPASPAPVAEMAEVPKTMARMAAKAAPLPQDVQNALREIAELRAQGEGEEAERRMERLKAEHPALNVEAELQHLPER